jgi:hypothetical protein
MSAEEYYNHVNFPVANTPGSSQAMRNEFGLVEAGFSKLPDLAVGAGKPVVIKADGSGMEAVATFPDNTFGNVSTLAHGLAPKLPGSTGLFLRGDGAWGGVGNAAVLRLVRTSNVQLANGNASNFIDITSGTFTQTFDACATLGSGWYAFIRNAGTGDITLDPNGAELIDGLSSYIMYPGEVRFVQCDGTTLTTFVIQGFNRTFTATGTFVKPPGYQIFEGEIWNGGSSGAKAASGNVANGGGGGGMTPFTLPASMFAASETMTVGAGGLGVSVIGNGNIGGASSIGTILVMKAAAAATSGSSLSGAATTAIPVGFEGVQGNQNPAVLAIYGGGGPCSNTSGATFQSSIYGGAAGMSQLSTGLGGPLGVSIFGGNGGTATGSGTAGAGVAPGGGGGGTTGTTSGAGARGEIRIRGRV